MKCLVLANWFHSLLPLRHPVRAGQDWWPQRAQGSPAGDMTLPLLSELWSCSSKTPTSSEQRCIPGVEMCFDGSREMCMFFSSGVNLLFVAPLWYSGFIRNTLTHWHSSYPSFNLLPFFKCEKCFLFLFIDLMLPAFPCQNFPLHLTNPSSQPPPLPMLTCLYPTEVLSMARRDLVYKWNEPTDPSCVGGG